MHVAKFQIVLQVFFMTDKYIVICVLNNMEHSGIIRNQSFYTTLFLLEISGEKLLSE